MTLELKGQETEKEVVDLEKSGTSVNVRINDELIAVFYDNGKFEFYGSNIAPIYDGRWKR